MALRTPPLSIMQNTWTLWTKYLQRPKDIAKASDPGRSSQQMLYKHEVTNKARLIVQLGL